MNEPSEADKEKAKRLCRALYHGTGCASTARTACACDEIAAAQAEAREQGRREERRACWDITSGFGSETGFAIRDAIAARGPMEPKP